MRHIEVTDDGSPTVRHPDLGVTYHSMRGAIAESRHVFIRHGLSHVSSLRNNLSILEVGFGTGLNALLTYLFVCDHPQHTFNYVGIEKFPLDKEITDQLNYPHLLNAIHSEDVFRRMHQARDFVHGNFEFRLEVKDILDLEVEPDQFDVVYFDAFAPGAQPGMWEPGVFELIVQSMRSGAVLVTFCAQGQFKRTLKSLGLTVEALPGPPGKREMVRATKK